MHLAILLEFYLEIYSKLDNMISHSQEVYYQGLLGRKVEQEADKEFVY